MWHKVVTEAAPVIPDPSWGCSQNQYNVQQPEMKIVHHRRSSLRHLEMYSLRQDTTGRKRLSTGNCARNLTMLYIHDLHNSMNERNTLLYKNISLTLFSKRAHSLLLVWEIDGETYTQIWDFFSYLLPGARGANACTPLQACQRRPNPLIGCVSLVRLRFSAL